MRSGEKDLHYSHRKAYISSSISPQPMASSQTLETGWLLDYTLPAPMEFSPQPMNISDRQSMHGQWSSRWTFILAATGAAVGLGNIWKFPYLTGQNGGSAFVLIYIICVAALGIPPYDGRNSAWTARALHPHSQHASPSRGNQHHAMVADHRLVGHHRRDVNPFLLQRHWGMDAGLYI